MPNPFFKFKQFTIHHDKCAMKVTTDACLFGAWVASEMKNEGLKIKNVLDVGTGAGLLSLMVVQKNDVAIDAVEIDANAAQQAIDNVNSSPWKEQIKIINTDINDFGKVGYDIIISNPPFYENELASHNAEKNIAHHSQQLTLQNLLQIINEKMIDEGKCFLLLPYKRKAEIVILLQKHNLFVKKSAIVKQSVLHQPFRWMIQITKVQQKFSDQELSIWNENQQYTQKFTDLLQDYYLYL
jgi:tRNA1Val (adenine37-N6)-methyltransferase